MSASKGLSHAREIYSNRNQRVMELTAQGKKAIGYICMFAPPEIMTAADIIPYRITGSREEPIVTIDNYIEPYGCPYIRNLFEQALKGKLDFLDGIVMCHSCDMLHRIYGVWIHYHKPDFHYCVNVPHTTAPWSRRFFKRELEIFKENIEAFSGKPISREALCSAIDTHNQNKALVRELYELRKQDPPRLTGSEMLQVLVAGSVIPPEEFNELLRQVTEEVNTRNYQPEKKRPRILLYGSINDDITITNLVEECGADIVIDDLCIGTKSYWHDVVVDNDPIEALADYYLMDFNCPRTYQSAGVDRFSYITDLAKEFSVDGVIAYILSYCDPCELDVPVLQRYLEQSKLPTLIIGDDYSPKNVEAIRTRVEAFVEMVGKG